VLRINGEEKCGLLSYQNHDNILSLPTITSRRNILFSIPAIVVALSNSQNAYAEEDQSIGSDPKHPIAIVGAGGKVGTICTQILSSRKLYVKAITRDARSVLSSSSDYVTYASGDVRKLDSINNAIKGCSGVIFTASASKQGGDAAHVDYLGVANIAKACVKNGIPKLVGELHANVLLRFLFFYCISLNSVFLVSSVVVISSLAVTRPDSIGFKVTNIFGRIMVRITQAL